MFFVAVVHLQSATSHFFNFYNDGCVFCAILYMAVNPPNTGVECKTIASFLSEEFGTLFLLFSFLFFCVCVILLYFIACIFSF